MTNEAPPLKSSLDTLRELGRRLRAKLDDYRDAPAERRGGIPEISPERVEKSYVAPVREEIESPINRMHLRLAEWAAVMLRGGSPGMAEDGPDGSNEPAPEWTGIQKERAAALHSLIIRLPEQRLNLTLQVFYKDRSCTKWYDLETEKRREVAEKHAKEVNYRLGMAKDTDRIRADAVDGIRWRAIRILVNNERLIDAAHKA